jgi:hypothetical protein
MLIGLVWIGVYGAAPPLVTWVSNNVQPFYKRATAIAFAFVMTNAGGKSALPFPPHSTVLLAL